MLDPELGIDVVSLGLVFSAEIEEDIARVRLGMTSPTCPMGDMMVSDAKECIRSHLPELKGVMVELTDELWSPERMSPETRHKLGWPDPK